MKAPPEYVAAHGLLRGKSVLVTAAAGQGEAISFARHFIANPDLVERMQNDWPLAEGDRATYYGVSDSIDKGYTDYPEYAAANA